MNCWMPLWKSASASQVISLPSVLLVAFRLNGAVGGVVSLVAPVFTYSIHAFAMAPLPLAMPSLALGDPASLLRRRPDIRAAGRSLAAATARIGVATADLFPRVTFVGSVGLQADTFAGLGKSGADTWNFGPRITWAALDLGRVQARIKA